MTEGTRTDTVQAAADTIRPVKKDLVIAAIVIAVVAAVAFGLSTMRPDLPLSASKPSGGDRGGDSPSKKKAEGAAVMHVDGVPVTETEFAAFMQSVPENARQFYATPAGRRALADEIVRIKLLEKEAKRLGVDNDPAVNTRLEMMRSQMVAGLALEKLMKDRMEPAIRAEYEKEKAGSMNLRHILVAYRGGAAPPKDGKVLSAEQAMTRAAGLVARIRGGAEFADVARRESDDQQSALEGGSLGPAKPEMLPPEVAAVVKTLQPGKVSDPVKTQFGVHIFMTSPATLEEMRPMLSQQVQQKIMMETLEGLQKGAKIDLDPKYFPPDAAPPRPRANG